MESKEFVRQALHAVTAESRTIEQKFVRLFSALETLVLKHRRDSSVEFVFPPDEWKNIQKQLRKAMNGISALANDNIKRCLVYENLSGLNRISLRTAYAAFCTYYQIELDDLWPVCGSGSSVTLADIRNRLVHGVPLERKQLNTVCIATRHLEWILERALLKILGWPLENSRVGPIWLRNMVDYLNWKGLTL
jgi:hypothetical protein